MEHLLLEGGQQYLPFARNQVKRMRAVGLPYMSKVFEIEGSSIRVRITPTDAYISISGSSDPLYHFFTTGAEYQGAAIGSTDEYLGYVVGVKYDSKTMKLRGAALGSSFEADTEDPPRWNYSSDYQKFLKFLPYRTFQQQALPQHIFYPAAKTEKLLHTVWTSPIEIGDANSVRYRSAGLAHAKVEDRGYDTAPELFSKPGWSTAPVPDMDEYRRAAVTTVVSDEYGSRQFFLQTDISGLLHVYEALDIDYALSEASPYAAIKTSIKSDFVVVKRIPHPVYARQYDAAAVRDSRLADEDYQAPMTSKRWEFNSAGTKMASVLVSDIDRPINGDVTGDQSSAGKEIGGIESALGMQEIEIVIQITGKGPEDFTVGLNVINEVGLQDDRCIVGVGYYWGDIEGLHSPTGIQKDTLLSIELDVFRKQGTAAALEPAASEMMTFASVKEFDSGRVVDRFVVNHSKEPLGLRGETGDNSFCKQMEYAYSTLIYNGGGLSGLGSETVTLLSELFGFIEDTFAAPGFTSTLEAQAVIEAAFAKCCDDIAENISDLNSPESTKRFYRNNLLAIREGASRFIGHVVPTVLTRTMLLAYDLRALAFAFKRSYFVYRDVQAGAGEWCSREDKITIKMRGEVKHQTAEMGSEFTDMEATYADLQSAPAEFTRVPPQLESNPKNSLFAFYSITQGRGAIEHSSSSDTSSLRTDFNAEYAVGRLSYTTYANELMVCGPYDTFCVHPHGHWSIRTYPAVYYPLPVKYFMPGHYPNKELFLPADDPRSEDVVNLIVDIVSVVVTSSDQAGEKVLTEVKSSHLDLFNQAYFRSLQNTTTDWEV